jgi:hypothetical protein
MKEIHGSTGFWRRGGEVVFSHRSVLKLCRDEILAFDFDGYYGFSLKILLYFF